MRPVWDGEEDGGDQEDAPVGGKFQNVRRAGRNVSKGARCEGKKGKNEVSPPGTATSPHVKLDLCFFTQDDPGAGRKPRA